MAPPINLVIEGFYAAINQRNLPAAIALIDEDCIYEDLNFSQPFQGKETIQALLTESCDGIPDDLLFIVDDITDGDSWAAGVLWHVELDGIPFPNGRGASFYRLSDATGKLVFARDIVEPPLKPGRAAFFIIRLVTPIIRRLNRITQISSVDSSSGSSTQPRIAIFLGILAVSYIYWLLLSPPGFIPGEPAWAIQPETWQEVIDESTNFFFILPLLNMVGITVLKAPIVHPLTEALFNFAEAWIFMFLPLLLTDQRGRNLPRIPTWGMAMFLTNAFLTPYMAVRAMTPLSTEQETSQKGLLARSFGWTGLIVGAIAIAWAVIGRPEFGGLMTRLDYFSNQLMTSRVTVAFCIDLFLFAVFQAVLLGAIEPLGSKKRWLRFFPFWGLAVWLII
ncbi:MAG: nuclear transport factor 2 family protein [Cyanobacteria bacterium P01_H01_bin.15]